MKEQIANGWSKCGFDNPYHFEHYPSVDLELSYYDDWPYIVSEICGVEAHDDPSKCHLNKYFFESKGEALAFAVQVELNKECASTIFEIRLATKEEFSLYQKAEDFFENATEDAVSDEDLAEYIMLKKDLCVYDD